MPMIPPPAALRMPSPAAPWLVADIGGTHARFGLVAARGGPVGQIVSLRCADFAGPEAALHAYLADAAKTAGHAIMPSALSLALAAPVDGDEIALTNSRWYVSRPALQAAFGDAPVRLLNDFEALALAVPSLDAADLRPLGPGQLDPRRPVAVIGPGTGLGVAACIPARDGWIALPTEGGHMTLAAADEVEADWLRRARHLHPHVSAERLLSGSGLPLLYRVVAESAGVAYDPRHDAAAITDLGLRRSDRSCTRTVEAFCALLGSFAGSAALMLGARGGVLLAGGVTQVLADALPASRFRERFEAKGRFRDYLSAVHTCLLVGQHASLRGAAQALCGAAAAPTMANPG
jgi:glucokinase